jgi:kumamolisin
MTPRGLFRFVVPLAILGMLAAGEASGEWASGAGDVVLSESSIEQPENVGLCAHTNFKMFVPNAGMAAHQSSPEATPQASGPPFRGYFYETPASLACVYQLVGAPDAACDPNAASTNPSGGSRALAIVDAYHYPTAMSDLQVFSAQFGLPAPTSANFQVVYANGRQPRVNADWNIEAALDIQWAHAMAPQAKIYLVEAASANFADLLYAVSVANSLVKSAGGGQVSMGRQRV